MVFGGISGWVVIVVGAVVVGGSRVGTGIGNGRLGGGQQRRGGT